MNKEWVTADQHFYHKNILKFCGRDQFKDVYRMNDGLIKYHNELVAPEDTVYHLGDFAMIRKDEIMKLNPIMKKLNGTHHLILGNHDEGKPFTYLKIGFMSVHTALFVDKFLLIHDPAHAVVVDVSQKVLCGHLHQLCLKVSKNILNVGVDVWGYKPVSIEYIRENWDNLK